MKLQSVHGFADFLIFAVNYDSRQHLLVIRELGNVETST